MPIACNMIPKSFSFGEFILKEGEIPKGLYLIKSGQCKVGSTRIAERPIKGDFDLNKKLGERKKIMISLIRFSMNSTPKILYSM